MVVIQITILWNIIVIRCLSSNVAFLQFDVNVNSPLLKALISFFHYLQWYYVSTHIFNPFFNLMFSLNVILHKDTTYEHIHNWKGSKHAFLQFTLLIITLTNEFLLKQRRITYTTTTTACYLFMWRKYNVFSILSVWKNY